MHKVASAWRPPKVGCVGASTAKVMQPRGERNRYRPERMVAAMGFVVDSCGCDEMLGLVHENESDR